MTAGWLQAGAGRGLLLCLACAACLALDVQQNCNATQYEAHGRCCSRCPPGRRVRVPCAAEGSDTICVPCQPRHFQDTWTSQTSCTPHRYCDQNAGLVVRVEGDATQNVLCQCRSGTHCSGEECQTCRENTACGPGEGVEQTATDRRDTSCTACPVGFFSNMSSATASCQLWRSCEAMGLLHKANGTRFSDTICEEAQKARSGVLVPAALAAVILVLGCVGLLLWHRHWRRQEFLKRHPHQDPARQQPGENEEEEVCPALPIQETRPTPQEEAKDSRLAVEERA